MESPQATRRPSAAHAHVIRCTRVMPRLLAGGLLPRKPQCTTDTDLSLSPSACLSPPPPNGQCAQARTLAVSTAPLLTKEDEARCLRRVPPPSRRPEPRPGILCEQARFVGHDPAGQDPAVYLATHITVSCRTLACSPPHACHTPPPRLPRGRACRSCPHTGLAGSTNLLDLTRGG